MRRTLTGTETALAAYWRFDEASGATVTDRTANHNDGLLGNGVARMQPARVASTAPLAGTGSAPTPPATQRTVVASEPLDPATVTVDRVAFTGPGGSNLGPLPSLVYDNRGLTATFAPQFATGAYTLAFGPDIRDLAGNPLDQDGDGTPGESGADVFREVFSVTDTTGPRIVGHSPGGVFALSRFQVAFNEPIPVTSFTRDDVTLTGPAGEIPREGISIGPPGTVQWSDTLVSFSSQYSTTRWSAAQAVGVPNTFGYGDIDTAWETASANMGLQWIQVGFSSPAFATGVVVRETWNSGFVRQIDLIDTDGTTHQAWSGIDPGPLGAIAEFRVDFPMTDYRVQAVKVTIDTNYTTSWESIDAIAICAASTAATATAFDVLLPRQTQMGEYQLTIGPDVTDLAGNLLDQDGDGHKGEPADDVYEGHIRLTARTNASGAVSMDTTWSGTVYVTSDVTVNAGKKLTILPGTVVKLNPAVRILVYGTLDAKGTDTSPIVFTSYRDDTIGGDLSAADFSTGLAGDWENLLFETGSDASELQNVEVRFAGNYYNPGNTSGYTPAVRINNGNPKLTDVRVVSSDGVGVGLYGGAPTLTRVTVDGARQAAFEGNLAAQPTLSALTATSSGVNGYELNGGTLASPAERTWSFGGLAALVDGEIALNAGTTVTIAAGQVIKLRGYGDIEFYGALNAVGTAAQPIIFTSYRDDSVGGDTNGDGPSVPLPGDWDELYFNPQGTVALQQVQVRYGGNEYHPGDTGGYRAVVNIDDDTPASSLALTDVQVLDADSTGVYVQGGAPQLTRVSVSRARHDAFRGSLAADPTLSNLTAAASGGNRYLVDSGAFSGQHTWWAGGLPIQLSGDIAVGAGAQLTIAAGQVVKFPQGGYLSVAGTLKAQGTAEQPIVFTSWRDDSVGGDANSDGTASVPAEGDWETLYLEPGSDASALEYLQIRYAGNPYSAHSGYYAPALRFRDTAATARHIAVAYADNSAVRFESGSPTVEDIQVTHARGYAYSLGLTAHPFQTNLTARDNWYDACAIDAGTFDDNTLDITTIPYALAGDVTVRSAKTLTIAPGVVFKLGNGQAIEVDGTLKALGTLAEPIVFTSRQDDSVLGDTYHDGGTVPVPGDWAWLRFNATSTLSELDHVDLRYGGNVYSPGSGYRASALRVYGSSPSIRNTRVLHADGNGVEIAGLGAQPSLEQVSVQDAWADAFTMDLAAQPTLVGLTASGSNGNRVAIAGGTLGTGLERTWNTDGLPLQITDDIAIPATSTVNIVAGQVVKVAQGVYLSVSGQLNAIGTAGQPIVFTSAKDDSVGRDANNDGAASRPAEGDWEAIYLEPGSDASVLEHVQIRYAGNLYEPHSGYGTPALRFKDTAATARHVLVQYADSTGVRIEDGSPTLEDVRVTGARGYAFNANLAATPTTANLSAADNWYDAFLLDTGHVPSPQQLRLTVTQFPYTFSDDSYVDAGATLTLDPGVVFKMNYGHRLQIDGTLDVNGTASQGVVFTSRQDDTLFGDTFHDGPSVPQRGDWAYLHIAATGTATLENLTVRYAGNIYSPGYGSGHRRSLYVDGATTATNLQVRDGDGGGISVRSNATFTVTGGVFADNDDINLAVESGTANLTNVGIFSSPVGIDVASGANAIVHGSAFSPLAYMPTAMTNANTTFTSANATGNWWGHPCGPNDQSAGDGRTNLNSAAPAVSDWVDYSGYLTSPPALVAGPYVVAVAGDPTTRSAWRAEGDPADVAGRHNGTLQYGTTFAPGKVGQAFSFDGVNDFVDLGAWSPGTAWTVAAWVNPTTVPATGRRGIVGANADYRDWGLSLGDGNYVATVRIPGGGVTYLNSNVAATAGTWTHLVATSDGQTARVYVDGVLKNSRAVDPNYSPTSSGTRIGGEVCCGGNNFPGLIDEVSILNRALTDAEVQSLFQGTFTPTMPSLDVTFSEPIDLATFTSADIAISGPQATTVSDPAIVGASTYRVNLTPPLTTDGVYQVSVGPAIAAPSGYPLDQDREGSGSEPVQDVFVGTLTVDRTGPRIVSSTPTGTQPGAVDHVEVTFSEPISPASFTVGDATITGPRGAIQPLSVTALSATQFRIGFATQSANGGYSVRIGPCIVDQAGNEFDQDRDGIGGELADDVYTAAFSISLQPVWISGHTPTGTLTTAADHVDVTFGVPILATSFTPTDVRLTGPQGVVPVTGVSLIQDNTYRITFAALTAEGNYTALVGPEITDAAGNLMDQDRDSVRGEPEDRYPATFAILAVGPRALSYIPNTTVPASVNAVDVTFSEPLQLGSFTPVDIVLTGPQGGIAVTGVAALGNNVYRLSFPAQSLSGTYSFTLGPYVNDLGGTPMNQDLDANNGEAGEDAYSGSFVIDNTGPRIVATNPTGQLPQYFANLTVEFSETIVATTFTTADVTLTGPNGPIAVLSVTKVDNTHYRIAFANQTTPGTYEFRIGPQITDLVGNALDQNADGLFGQPDDVAVIGIGMVLPNLTVSATTSPPSIAAGENLTVTWTVRNTDLAAAQPPWTDRVVLSRDQYFGNSDDVQIDASTTTQALVASGTYDRQATLKVPFGLEGAFRIMWKVDTGNTVSESDETDNLVSAPIDLLYAPPPADLRVDAVTIPGTAASGETISVAWRVTNAGTATTESSQWSDRVYLSNNDTLGGDVELATFAHSGVLEAAGSYAQVQDVRLPVDLTAGNYWLFVQTDVYGQLAEPGAENNNVGRSAAAVNVTLAPVPNLVVPTVSGPASAVIGQPLAVTWTVRNTGGAAAVSPWTDGVYLTTDGSLAGAALLGSFVHTGDLAPTGEYTRTESVTLPVMPDGDYYLAVVTDTSSQVFERDGESDNQGTAGTALRATHPDLVLDVVTPSGTPVSGKPLDVSWTARNAGTGPAAGDWLDRVYLSLDATLSADDVLLGSLAHAGPLASGVTYAAQLTVTLPNGVSGPYRLLVVADAADKLEEGSVEDNNSRASAEFNVQLAPYADLAVDNVTAPELIIGDPADLPVSWRVTNVGTGAGDVDTWVDRVVLSPDAVPGNGDDRVVGEYVHTGLMPIGTAYTRLETVPLPAELQGRFNLFVITDAADAVYEHTNSGANAVTPSHVVDVTPKPYADLQVDTVVADATGLTGQPLVVTWTVSNTGIGLTDVTQWVDQVRLSSDPTGQAGLITLGDFSHVGTLGIGDTYTRRVDVKLPALATGTYYVFVDADVGNAAYEFLYNGNNRRRSAAVSVTYVAPPPADLEAVSVSGPATATDGGGFDVTWTVRNSGTAAATGDWTDTLYLAPNGDFSRATVLGRFGNSQGLNAGMTYTRTERFQFPLHMQGLYQFYVQTDVDGTVAETNEANNRIGATQAITISLQPRPDLQVTALTIPDEVPAGGVIDVEFTVTNLGTARTPTGGSRWTDAVYLSLNNQFDGGDIRLGTVDNGSALEVGESYTTRANFQIPAAVAANVYIIAVADLNGRVDEYPHEDNNTKVKPLAVDVTPVPPPDLVVSAVTGPGTSFDDSDIVVYYQVANRGAGVTYPGSWSDTVWLTRGKDRPDARRGDVRLGTFGHSGPLDVDEFYTRDVTVHLPERTTGQFFLTVWADAFDAVYEQALEINLNPDAPTDLEGSNFQATPLTVLYTPPADLEVMDLTAPSAAQGGDKVTVSWTVANNGAVATDQGRWADAVYVSSDTDLHDGRGTTYMVFGVPHVGALEPGQSYTEEVEFTLPPSAEGAYFIVETNVDPKSILTEEDFLLEEMGDFLGQLEQRLGKPLSDM